MEIKKVVLNSMYGCWGAGDYLNRESVAFAEKSVKYSRKPQERSNQHNPLIEVSYNPNEDWKLKKEYPHDFAEIKKAAKSLMANPPEMGAICDAIGPVLEITTEDNKKIAIEGADEETAAKVIYLAAEKYRPMSFLVAEEESEEIQKEDFGD